MFKEHHRACRSAPGKDTKNTTADLEPANVDTAVTDAKLDNDKASTDEAQVDPKPLRQAQHAEATPTLRDTALAAIAQAERWIAESTPHTPHWRDLRLVYF